MKLFTPDKAIDNSMRPIPFWSWNDRLSADELRSQIRSMHEAGFGGFFMHARGGLQTPYMSKEYLECVSACVDEAAEFGMDAYLYDENGWPSGYADGRVNGLGEDFQQKFLSVYEDKFEGDFSKIVAVYRKKDGKRVDISSDTQNCYIVAYEVNPCYVDIFNSEATTQFIQNTHQYYYDNLPENIRKNIKGIFTDEPQIVIGRAFYSKYYADEFQKKYGENLFDNLIKLWYDFEGCEEFRSKYYKLAGELFAENYTKKIHNWCREHNWILTGHMVQEINYAEQCYSSGAVSFHYPYFDIAGIDHLGRIAPNAFLIRQMTSVAAQFGISRRMVEVFACLGWDLSFDNMRYYYHILQVHGVNFLCHHLFAYSLRGLRKRDYPPSFGVHVPYFAELKSLNDEFSRTNQFIAEGEEQVSTLLLHAQNSVWANYHGNNDEEKIANFIKSTEKITEFLGDMQVPFHFGFEPHLECFGEIENGILKLGKFSYDTIILPKIDRLQERTYELLRQFEGKIYRTHGMLKKVGELECTEDEIAWFNSLPLLDEEIKGIIEVEGEKSQIRSNSFAYENGNLYMIVNHSQERSFEGRIHFPKEKNCRLYQIDELTGAKEPFFAENELEILPSQAIWVFADKNSIESEVAKKTVGDKSEIKIDNFYFKEVPQNYLPLDNVRYSINDGEFIADDISVVQWELLKRGNSTKCDLEFEFFIDDDFELSNEINVVVETPDIFTFELNNHQFEWQKGGFLFDKSLQMCRLDEKFLQKGKNTLTLHTVFNQSKEVYEQLEKCKYFETAVNSLSFDMEIEQIYLAGKFGVKCNYIDDGARCVIADRKMTLCNFDKTQKLQDLHRNSLPFWAGKMRVETQFEITNNAEDYKILAFELENLNAAKLWVNDSFVAIDNHDTSLIEIPANLLKNGKNKLEFELISNLRNFMGPFHVNKEILINGSVSPGTFGKVANVFTGGRTPDYQENYCIKKTAIKNIKVKKG
ncbi:MAG: hypothetical protein IJW31_07780 [Lentisphaeria bacterium]|nr:hypothetical protein [Lentisphaeria bacterium]